MLAETFKKILLVSLFFILFFSRNCFALEDDNIYDKYSFISGNEQLSERVLMLDLSNPLKNYEANSNLFLSINQLSGRANDFLGIRLNSDNYRWSRILLLFGSWWLSVGESYYSHEIAHLFRPRENGLKCYVDIDMNDWWSHLWPRYKALVSSYREMTDEDFLGVVVEGLNQWEFNSFNKWSLSVKQNQLSLNDAVYFFIEKLWDMEYILHVGFDDFTPRWKLNYIAFLGYCDVRNLHNDIDVYTIYLSNFKNIELKKTEYLGQTMLADFLSLRTWESTFLIIKYLFSGNRYSSPWKIEFNDNLKILPPIINLYATSKGGFFNSTSLIQVGKSRNIFLSFGLDADGVGGGEVDCFRLGVNYQDLNIAKFSFAPFFNINTTRNLQYKGASIGMCINFRINENILFRTKYEYNDNDIIENVVKNKDEGSLITLGFAVRI